MDKKINIAIIGTGGICYCAHLPSYALIKERVNIAALCDIVESKAIWNRDEYKLSCDIYTDYKEVLKRSDIDAVDICTPNDLHSEIAIAALVAGKHVFCEKPDAINIEQVLKMQSAADLYGKTLMVMRNNRFSAGSQFLKNYINSGKSGQIYAGRCGWIRRRGIPGKGGWFTTKSRSGGGPLIDLGVHMIDLAVWLMGNPVPISVTGSIFRKFADDDGMSDSGHAKFGEKQIDGVFDVEDLAMGFIKFDNGACLQIEFSWASNIECEMNFVELRGEKAGITWKNEKIEIYYQDQGYPVDLKPHTSSDIGGHELNIIHFIDVIEGKTSPLFEPEQGVNMIKILSALYESANTNKEVLL